LWFLVLFPSRLLALLRTKANDDPSQSLLDALQLLIPPDLHFERTWLYHPCWKILFDPLATTVPVCLRVDTVSISSSNAAGVSYPSADVIQLHASWVGWRLRRRARSIEKRQLKARSTLTNDAHIACYLGNDIVESTHSDVSQTFSASYLTAITDFVSSFNPATTGIRMLGVERLDKDKLKRITRRRHVSVDLRRCRRQMLDLCWISLFSLQ
jgi:hypothetical protein